MIWNYAKLQESHCIFPHKRNLYKHGYRDTPTTPPPPLSWVQTFPPSSCHLKIRLVRPSLTFLGHHTLLIWQDWLVFTAVFSVTSIYLENATTHAPLSTKFPPWLGSTANIVQQPKYNYHAKFGAFTPKCTIFSPYGLTIWKTHK